MNSCFRTPGPHRLLALALLTFILLLALPGWALTWADAYPYVQTSPDQRIVIKAYPYRHRGPSFIAGRTLVFDGTRLLYSLPDYYRYPLLTSDDGRFLAMLITEPEIANRWVKAEASETLDTALCPFDYNVPAIRIFHDGQPYRDVPLSQLVNTRRLPRRIRLIDYLAPNEGLGDSPWFSSGWLKKTGIYHVPYGQYMGFSLDNFILPWTFFLDDEADKDARWECDYCRQTYGNQAIDGSFNSTKIDRNHYNRCRDYCRQVAQNDAESQFAAQPYFLRNNHLYIRTHSNRFVDINFDDDARLRLLPFRRVIPDRQHFLLPRVQCQFDTLARDSIQRSSLSDPLLSNGQSIKAALHTLFRADSAALPPDTELDISGWFEYDTTGQILRSEYLEVTRITRIPVPGSSLPSYHYEEQPALTDKLRQWATGLRLQPALIPPNFPSFGNGFSVRLGDSR